MYLGRSLSQVDVMGIMEGEDESCSREKNARGSVMGRM
jgi:hypothetical protein